MNVTKDLAKKIKLVADHQGKSVVDYVSEILAPIVKRDYEKSVAEMQSAIEQERKKKPNDRPPS